MVKYMLDYNFESSVRYTQRYIQLYFPGSKSTFAMELSVLILLKLDPWIHHLIDTLKMII